MSNEQLVKNIQQGADTAENMAQLYRQNLPLIRMICKPYEQYEPLDDLMQESFFGLVDAVKHFESSKNVLFMTYAGYWIRARLAQYCRRNRGRFVDSLDKELPSMPGMTLGDTLRDETADVESAAIDAVDREALCTIWGIVEQTTNERTAAVFRKLFLYNVPIVQIAAEYHVSPTRVAQIRDACFRKLRKSKALQKLAETDSLAYHGGYEGFRLRGSIVEHVALREIELLENRIIKI